MYKSTLLIGALLTAFLMRPGFADNEPGQSHSPALNEDMIAAARGTAQDMVLKKYGKNVKKRAQLAAEIGTFSLFPQEKDILELPDPLKEKQGDAQALSLYYRQVAKVYQNASQKAANEYAQAHTNREHVRQRVKLEGMRVENRKSVDATGRRIVRNKEYLQPFPLDSQTPSKSQKYFPPSVDQSAQNAAQAHEEAAAAKKEIYALKAEFYESLAAALSFPDPPREDEDLQ